MYFMLNLSARKIFSYIYRREARGSGTAQLGLKPDVGRLACGGLLWRVLFSGQEKRREAISEKEACGDASA